jgi:hypothetical protein
MAHDSASDEQLGRHVARKAIAAGVPRWAVLGNLTEIQGPIHEATGLPFVVTHATGRVRLKQEAFIRGHNDEIYRALSAGEISVDFRPFLPRASKLSSAVECATRFLSPITPIGFDRYSVKYESLFRGPREPSQSSNLQARLIFAVSMNLGVT